MPPDSGGNEYATTVVELRTSMTHLAAEVSLMRAALGPLAALPHQLETISQLHAERVKAVQEEHRRDTAALRQDLAEVQGWQTWAVRLVLGLVMTAVVGAVLVVGT